VQCCVCVCDSNSNSNSDPTLTLVYARTFTLAHPRIKKESDLVKKVPRAPLLELYTNYFFDSIPAVQKREIFEVLCFNFLLFMMNKKLQGSDVEDDSSYVNSWFLFDIIIKSMALHLAASNELGGMCVVQTIACIDMWTDCVRVVVRVVVAYLLECNRTGKFEDSFTRTLSKLLGFFAQYFRTRFQSAQLDDIRILNRNLAMFIKDLFCVFDRGIVLDMVWCTLQHNNSLSLCSLSLSLSLSLGCSVGG
jgi:hypothetical protein